MSACASVGVCMWADHCVCLCQCLCLCLCVCLCLCLCLCLPASVSVSVVSGSGDVFVPVSVYACMSILGFGSLLGHMFSK
jgi:hypothetical protein